MHKKFVFWLALMVVFVFGMIFQSMISRGTGSSHLASHGTLPNKKGSIAGGSTPKVGSAVGVAQFSATLKNDTVVLEGQLDSKVTVDAIVLAAQNASGVTSVDNQLVVGANIVKPEWSDSISEYLTTFLSNPGVEQFAAEGSGLRLMGEVSPMTKNKLGNLATRLVSDNSLVSNDLKILEREIASVLIAKKVDGEVTITGNLSSEDFRTKLVDLVGDALPNTPVNDKTKVAANVVEPWWTESAENLVPMFLTALETEGSIEYWQSHLLVSGSLASEEVAGKMNELAAGFGKPEGYSINSDLRLVPQEDPEVSLFRDERGHLNVEGKVASTILKNQIIGGLMRHNPDVTIKDKLEVKESVKALNLGDPGRLVKDLMFDVKGGMLRITEGGIKIAGEANTAALKEKLLGHATAVIGSTGKVDSILTSAKALVSKDSSTAPVATSSTSDSSKYTGDPDAKNVNFKALSVYFNSGRATVRDSQISNLRLSARILNTKIPNTRVIVGGYADRKGDAEFNRELSLKRANSVREILVSYGVARDRMDVQFFGEDTSNTQTSDLWRSRRVELSVANQ